MESTDKQFTGVMNALGQDGNYKSSMIPIKNRVNALDRGTKEANKALKEKLTKKGFDFWCDWGKNPEKRLNKNVS